MTHCPDCHEPIAADSCVCGWRRPNNEGNKRGLELARQALKRARDPKEAA